LTAVAVAALIMAALGIILQRNIQAMRSEIDDRQQYINQTIRISRLNTQFIQALASLSARTGDEQLRRILAEHGISFSADVMPEPEDDAANGAEAAPDSS